ncbi:4511_t:CDS:2 [Entrophospora sp. SA101]|nr:4511_t:CDS:2 [Entrophospora sp. SA101]
MEVSASPHVSEFLCEPIGCLRLGQVEKEHNSNLPENERIPEDDACTIIRPGINCDGYWTSDNLVDQENSRKRKQKKELNYTYGIVTTGTTWWYIMFVDEGKDVYTKD